MNSLEEIRKNIDAIDSGLLELFSRRMEAVTEVARIKMATKAAVFNPEREKQLLNDILDKTSEEMQPYAKSLFISLMRLSRLKQYTVMTEAGECPEILIPIQEEDFSSAAKVCYQGIEGSWSSQATTALFPGYTAYPLPTFDEVFSEVSSGRADYGVLPMENSTAGIITQVYDGLADYNCYIKSVYSQKVTNCLCAPVGASLKNIKRAFSHPHALEQCSDFLKAHSITPIPYPNTAMAAQMVAEKKNLENAALCSPDAARLYGLDILVQSADNSTHNETRFIALSKNLEGLETGNRMSITFTLHDESSGSLSFVLSLFGDAGINLTSIQSRPLAGKPWEHRFYLDFCGNPKEKNVRAVLYMMERELPTLKLLGCYSELI